MKYYEWSYDDRYLDLDYYVTDEMVDKNPELEAEYRQLFYYRYKQYPALEDWIPLRAFQDGTRKQLETRYIGDFGFQQSVSNRVIEHFGDILNKYGILYPFNLINACDEPRKFFKYVCSNIIDCVDMERSTFMISPSGEPYAFRQCFFDHDKLKHEPEIFALECGDVYVSEAFKEMVSKIKPKLTGLALKEEGIHNYDFDYKMWRSTPTLVKRKPKEKPVEKLTTVKEIQSYEGDDWEKIHTQTIAQIQIAVNLDQCETLEEIFLECLKACASKKELAKVKECRDKLNEFDKQFAATLKESIKKAKKNKDVKALYFEYYCSGVEEDAGSIFLCNQTEDDEKDWASDFDEFVGDIPVYEYFKYIDDLDDAEEFAEHYANFYIATSMLAIVKKHYKDLKPKYSLGFANHDWSDLVIIK